MIIRIVKMKFHPDYCEQFIQVFHKTRPVILTFDGCLEVKLLQSETEPTIFSTFSRWDSVTHLDHYRFSEFFKLTWSTIKPWMVEKADAVSYNEISEND
ncbi:MAG: antibiotic biosynthesis monooxygenase [Bacteroidetes bacterium]|nr:antibiotic biosynthesis monooxygenase [Bacteroidota bacterium]